MRAGMHGLRSEIRSVLIFLILLPGFQQVARGAGTAPSKVSVLIVDGFGNHDWQATTKDIKGILARDSAIACDTSTVPPENSAEWKRWLPDFRDYDVVIQNTNDIKVGGSWPRPAQIALEQYVSGGGGLYIFHSANNAFPEWKEYNRMIGLGWRNKDFGPAIQIVDGEQVLIPAGEGGNTSHGQRVDAVVTRINDHSIHQNLPPKWLAADLEIYRYARGPAENLTVISYAREPETKLNFPVEWVVDYGAGRVYNATYGHHWQTQKEAPAGIRCMAFQTIFLRAIDWLAKRRIDSTVPERFPGTEKVSLAAFAPRHRTRWPLRAGSSTISEGSQTTDLRDGLLCLSWSQSKIAVLPTPPKILEQIHLFGVGSAAFQPIDEAPFQPQSLPLQLVWSKRHPHDE